MGSEGSAAQSAVLLESQDRGVLTLTLNRPARLNAFSAELHGALAAALARAREDDDCRAVLLTGAGKAFSAGQDLTERVLAPDAARPDLGESLEKRYNPLIRTIRGFPKPVVCAVNGVAAGAAANVALACDIVLAAKSAKFLQAFTRIGLTADAGGTFLLPRLIGDARARAAILLAEPIGALNAEAWGMIHRAVDDDRLMEEAQALARKLAAGPTYAYALVKQALYASAANSLDAQLDLERDLQRKAGMSDDYVEGVRAFLEKRPPNFTGRARSD